MGFGGNGGILGFGFLRTALENQDDLCRGLLDIGESTEGAEFMFGGLFSYFFELILEIIENTG